MSKDCGACSECLRKKLWELHHEFSQSAIRHSWECLREAVALVFLAIPVLVVAAWLHASGWHERWPEGLAFAIVGFVLGMAFYSLSLAFRWNVLALRAARELDSV